MFKPLTSEKRSDWAENIRQQRNSGLNATDWCRKHQIAYSTFIYWKDCLSTKTTKRRSSFTEPLDASTTTTVSIEYRGVRVYLDKSFDLAALKKTLISIAEHPKLAVAKKF